MSTSSTISREVAAHVLSHFGRPGGYPAGDWTEALISLIDRADMTNRAKLLTAFPAYGAAIALAKYDEHGIEALQDIAAGRCPRCRQDDGPFTPAGLCEACARPMPLDGVA
ncbi:hypothetical protein OG864_45035 [Streptomyces sp. NBC_00124]|uniref:hypothetical protein n=1 Tax=Streptomyces sp. NBC_00124 TaxID=2975662 RepID=UPI002253594A|nr:hypothetical protein [Streptomyces sp. NBC_00124]MCX5365867.1 hypothetical protein [Streptomyces sp. NBC_00124]